MDYLQQANRDLEQQIKDLLLSQHEDNARSRDLQMKNEELCQELKNFDRIMKKVEEEKNVEIAVLRRQSKELQVSFFRYSSI